MGHEHQGGSANREIILSCPLDGKAFPVDLDQNDSILVVIAIALAQDMNFEVM